MDVYDTFYAYKKNGTAPSPRGNKDPYIKEIVHLMKESDRPRQTFLLHHADARPFCDQTFYHRSYKKMDDFAKYLGARVSMDWVKACASQVDPPGSVDIEMLDNTSARHIHIVNPDISFFLKLLQTNTKSTITYSRTEDVGYAIHLPLLYQQLSKICTNHPVLWFMVACSIGIPTHDMYTPQTFLCKWKKEPNRKLLSNENIIKTILKPIFGINDVFVPKEVEIAQLTHRFRDMETDFQNTETVNSVDDFMFKRIYAYPTSDEIKQLFDRVRFNLAYRPPTLEPRAITNHNGQSDEIKRAETRMGTRSTPVQNPRSPSKQHSRMPHSPKNSPKPPAKRGQKPQKTIKTINSFMI